MARAHLGRYMATIQKFSPGMLFGSNYDYITQAKMSNDEPPLKSHGHTDSQEARAYLTRQYKSLKVQGILPKKVVLFIWKRTSSLTDLDKWEVVSGRVARGNT